MPVQECTLDGKPGFRWGEEGKCYTYTPGDEASREAARAKAEKQGRAIEAQRASELGAPAGEFTMVREYTVGEFRGGFPDVPIAPQVDVPALTAGDDKPFFATLPIAEVGRESVNGLIYDEELVAAVEAQIVGRGGILGHIKPEERDTAFPIENVDWVGVRRVGQTSYGKCYIPPGEAREYVRRLKARGGKLATSIYGPCRRETLKDGRWRAREFRLEQVDLAPADRAALKLGGAFMVTAQMDGGNADRSKTEDTMATREEILAEMTVKDISLIPQAVREQIIADSNAAKAHEALVAELQGTIKAKDAAISDLQAAVERYQVAEFNAGLDALVAEFVNLGAGDDAGRARVEALRKSFRARVVAEIGSERDPARIKATAQTVWDAEFRPLAEMLVQALAGPSAIVGPGGTNWRDDLAKRAGDLRKQHGV